MRFDFSIVERNAVAIFSRRVSFLKKHGKNSPTRLIKLDYKDPRVSVAFLERDDSNSYDVWAETIEGLEGIDVLNTEFVATFISNDIETSQIIPASFFLKD